MKSKKEKLLPVHKVHINLDDTAFGVGDYTLRKAMSKMFAPWLQLSMAFATQIMIDLINISIIGRTGDNVALAAVSLGNIIIIMFVLSVM
jgi:hypothetical protein